MTLRQLLLAILLLAPCSALLVSAQENDEFGLWHEIGVEKAITKKWDVGLDLEYRSQNRSRFSAGLSTSYKVCKYLKLGIGYNFLYSFRPEKFKYKNNLVEKITELGYLEDYLQDPDNLEYYPDKWKIGYNQTPEYWYPRHRFSVEATGSVKLWNWLKVSLRERYQLTYAKARNVSQYKYRDVYEKFEYWDFPEPDPDDPWNWPDPILVREVEQTGPTEEWVEEYKPSFTDQVLRSRIKFEYDKKRFPFSPFISAEAHNSVSAGDHMLLQKVRTAIGSTYKFRKHNEVSLSYIITFNIYDVEDDAVVRQHDKKHALCLGYKYSF